jgi:DNA polymerase bacteriophage-type
MQRWLVPDFETVSDVNLKEAGAWRYSLDATTQVLCLSWEWDDGTRGSWTPLDGKAIPPQIARAIADKVTFVAHNAGFEKAIWRNIMVPDFGWPDIPDEQWADSMARCAELALPQKLEKACEVLRLPFQKDTAASRRTIALSQRGAVVTAEALADTVLYNVSDVDAQKALHKRVGWLTPGERRTWDLDQTVNGRGVMLDLDLVDRMQSVLAEAAAPLEKEFKQLTGYGVGQNKKVLAWVKDQGVGIDSLNKETVNPILEDRQFIDTNAVDEADEAAMLDVPDHVLRALQIRALIGSASVKKLDAMKRCVSLDGRARGLLGYHGASTGRWAGRLLQPQNFPRGSNEVGAMTVDDKLSMIYRRELELMATLFGSAYELVIGSIRHVLRAAPGMLFDVADYAQIEARIVLAAAGQRDKVDLLAAGENPYVDMGRELYSRVIDKKRDVLEYTISKNSVLGLGFNMGPTTFQRRYAKNLPLAFCEGAVKTYRTKWAPEVPKLWYGLGDAALKACTDGVAEDYGVEYRREDAWLSARLPSGRKLWYPFPELEKRHMPWSTTEQPDIRKGWKYHAWKMGQWRTVHAFGGLLAENLAQALARDLLVEAMFKCEAEGRPVVLTVHDEIVTEVSAGQSDHKMLEQIMEDAPAWARAMRIPVAAEGWSGERYRK